MHRLSKQPPYKMASLDPSYPSESHRVPIDGPSSEVSEATGLLTSTTSPFSLPGTAKVCTKSPLLGDTRRSWSPFKSDLLTLSVAFVLVFAAFGATQNLESSINTGQGLGPTALGVLYVSLTLFSFLAPPIVRRVGARNALLLGLTGYWLFVAANLAPSWLTLMPAAVYLGFTAAVLWVAQGSYLTYAAKAHAAACSLPEEGTVGSFNGIFWGLFQGNQVVGNLLSFFLLSRGQDASGHVAPATIRLLFLVFLLVLALGTSLALLLRSQATPFKAHPDTPPVSASSSSILGHSETGPGPDGGGSGGRAGNSGGEGCLGAKRDGERGVREEGGRKVALAWESFGLLGEPRMQLLIALLIYSGLQQAFIWSDFNKDVVTPSIGVSWVGGVMAALGAVDSLTSYVFGRLSSGLNSITVILCAGAITQFTVLLALCLKSSFASQLVDHIVLSLLASLWGVGDAAYNTQISSLLGICYPHQTEAAFAQFKIWQSLGIAASCFATPLLSLPTKLGFLLMMLLVAVVLFLRSTGVSTPIVPKAG